ncbi:2,4-dichlorophenol 6-monooxygenase, partial [Lachnellula willkommii]
MRVNSVTRTILQDTEKSVHNVSILPNGSLDQGSLWDEEVPVLIAGAGPSGLLEAYLLSCLGIKSLVIERYPKRLDAPKAHALSPRSMEIARQFGLDTNYMRSQGTSRADAYWVNFITNLSGRHIGRLPYERMDPGVLDATPEMIHNIPQPDFEAIVADALANDPNVEIRKNMSYVSCNQNQDGVTTEVEDRGAGHNFRVRSRHLVACDGAKSRVRSSLGIGSEGEDAYETMMTIHFDADLRPVVGENIGMLHWVIDPEVSGFIIGYELSDNQVLICNFDSEKHPLESWDEELCRKTVKAAIGRDDVPFNVLSFRPWVLSRKVANSYRVGNVFLAGDAAHSFPPTGGLGLNSGLADVHNLAYKIAAVHHGWGSSKLLDSYEDDRRHVALVNSAQSIKNGIKIFKMLKTFGLNNPDIAVARANLFKSIDDPAQKILIDEGVEGQQEHFDNLELHIGYVYGSKIYPSNASKYTPQYTPGARLPHVWITPLSQTALE